MKSIKDETIKPSILWVNKSKPRKVLNNITHTEEIIYQAHSLESKSLHPYVDKMHYDTLIQVLKKVETTGDSSWAAEALIKFGI